MATTTAALNPMSALVGRDRELGELRERLSAALAGQGGLVLIGGEAGIGKTALAEALCREAAAQGVLALIGRCYDLTETPPYGPWLEVFDALRTGDGAPSLPNAFGTRGSVGAVASQDALFTDIRDFLSALSGHHAVLLLLDDLHWADAASLDLLRFLARGLVTLPVLLLATYRNEEVGRQHPLYALLPVLVREAHAARLDLHPLDDAAIRTLVEERYHLGDADTARLVAHLRERADGNALFVGELLRSLEEVGNLRQEDGRWLLDDRKRASLPSLLRQVIDARLNRLDAASQQMLAIAAVIGQRVPLADWATVAAVDEDRLLAVVAEADGAHIMAEERDGLTAAFTHALVREALYEGMRPSERRRWHRVAGETLAATPVPDPDAVASHFERAGDRRAVAWLIAAGERAEQAWAWLTAAERYEAAVRLMEDDGSDARERGWLLFRVALMRRFGDPARALAHLGAAGRLAARAGDGFLAAQVAFYQGNVRCLAGDCRRGVTEMAGGIAALQAITPGDEAAPPWAAAAPSWAGIVPLSVARVTHYTWLGNVGQLAAARALGEEYASEILATVPGGRESGEYATAAGGLEHIYAFLGEDGASREMFEYCYNDRRGRGFHLLLGVGLMYALLIEVLPYRADAIAERRRYAAEAEEAWARGGGARAAVPARFACASVLFIEGAWDEARALALAGHTESGGYILSKAFAMMTLAPLAAARGDRALADWLVREWLPEGPGTAPGGTFIMATILQRVAAAIAIEDGDPALARDWLEAHDRWLAWSGAALGLSEGMALWAAYYRANGDSGRAHELAERALVHATTPRQPLALLTAHRLLGELETEAGRYDDAARHLAAAQALADNCQAPYERALTLLARAGWLAARGDRDAAHALLAEIRPRLASLGAAPALARADALAACLGTTAAPPAYPAGLSAREVEVLRFLAEGLSNRAIADRLFLSTRTVQVHVAHILQKTDAENRAAAAAFALRHGIA